MAFAPDGRLFWTERAGTVKVWQNGAAKTFASVSTTTTQPGGGYSERGLLGLALTPSFAQDHFVYALYTRADNLNVSRVVRWTDCGGNATGLTTIVDNLPAGSDCCHKGGRIAFSPDGFLFVTIGDNHVASAAQDANDLRGKVLKYNSGGAAAGINGTPVYTIGLRNPFGIGFAPDGRMAITNNGPSGEAGTPCGSCGDIFDLVGTNAGVRYEWANCWGNSHPFGGHSDCGNNTRPPSYSTEGGPYPKSNLFFVAPTGVTYANGHFLFCADLQSSGHVFQYNESGNMKVTDTGIGGCLLDVKQAPGGLLYTAGASSITSHSF
jgi:glucose/arabinose dehydrogenase